VIPAPQGPCLPRALARGRGRAGPSRFRRPFGDDPPGRASHDPAG